MSDPPPPREGNPPVGPPADAPAADPTDRAAADAARMEAERLRIEAAINLFNVNYNQNGGPPQLPRLISPNRPVGNAPNLPPWVLGGGPAQRLAQGGGQALQPDYSSSYLGIMVELQTGELVVFTPTPILTLIQRRVNMRYLQT